MDTHERVRSMIEGVAGNHVLDHTATAAVCHHCGWRRDVPDLFIGDDERVASWRDQAGRHHVAFQAVSAYCQFLERELTSAFDRLDRLEAVLSSNIDATARLPTRYVDWVSTGAD